MAEETLLTDDFLRQLINVGEVDILIGLPTYNNAGTIEPVIAAIQAGLLKFFPRERAVIINADAGSQDGTPAFVTRASIDDVWRASKVYALRTLHSITTQYASGPEPGIALRTILTAADLLHARACVVISAESTTINPDWIQRLIRPIFNDNMDFVSPVYLRHRSAGLLMRNLLYPMTRAVYGSGLHEPYASEFATSGRFASELLGKEIWDGEFGRIGAEMYVTVAAITGQYRVCQSFLGEKTPDRGTTDLVLAMRRTVGALFASLDNSFPYWSTVTSSQPVPVIDPQPEVTMERGAVDRTRLHEMFTHGVTELGPVFRAILSDSTRSELQAIANLSLDQFSYPAEVWAKTVFEFAASYHKSVISRDHIIQALVPLYRGRALTSLLENENASGEDFERNLESLCNQFERLKPYLLEVWADRK